MRGLKPRNQHIDRTFERLMSEPFDGNRDELAAEVGISTSVLQSVLDWVRRPEFIDEYGWTIPFVRRGGAVNRWRIVDTKDLADNETMRVSQHRRAQEMLVTTRKNIAQCALARAAVDGRSREGKLWNRSMMALGAAEAHLEMLLESR